ncbi:hypothetical protein [Acetobacterium bakii]|uniref:RNA polymerase sigma factor 70 region 4 type 2 domain-containing protein n=1 Tax=Acetobacterium bakii TaxID=52689 RepID=A0A0L6TZG8_9FIRM|nr:hypothetical protein [Acetobacterium bakii]KNZ41467.1 hypothetical protein AKG39_11930 [Acetobacterium bakii]
MSTQSIFESYYDNKTAFILVNWEIKEKDGFEVSLLQKRSDWLLAHIEFVDKLLSYCSEEEKKIIELRMQKMSWAGIASVMLMNVRTVQKKHDQVFKRLEKVKQSIQKN